MCFHKSNVQHWSRFCLLMPFCKKKNVWFKLSFRFLIFYFHGRTLLAIYFPPSQTTRVQEDSLLTWFIDNINNERTSKRKNLCVLLYFSRQRVTKYPFEKITRQAPQKSNLLIKTAIWDLKPSLDETSL